MYDCVIIHCNRGGRFSSVVESPLMVRRVVGSILHGGPIELEP